MGTYCFNCSDVGYDCDFACTAPDEDSLWQQIMGHGAEAHNLDKLSPETKDRIQKAIKKPTEEELGCDITAKEQGGEEDPGCAISG